MKKGILHIFLIVFLFGCSNAFSQENLNVVNFNASTELKQNVVFDMAFDNDGYLWIISVLGMLERYDGNQISIINEDQPEFKKKLFVSVFNIPSSKKTFVRTGDGTLYELKNGSPQFYKEPPKDFVKAPYLDGNFPTEKAMEHFNLQSDRPIWKFDVGIKNPPVLPLNDSLFAVLDKNLKKIIFYKSESRIGETDLSQGIEDLFLIDSDPILIDKLHHIYLIDKNTFQLRQQRVQMDSSMNEEDEKNAISFFSDRDHHLVFAEYKNSIYELVQNKNEGYFYFKKIFTTKFDLRHVTAIMYEPISNKYFIGTIENGFYIFSPQKIQTIKINEKLPFNYPYMESLLYCLHEIGDNTAITTSGVELREDLNGIHIERKLKSFNYCGVISSKGKDTLFTTYNNQIKYSIKTKGYKETVLNTSPYFINDHIKIILPEGDSLWVFGGRKYFNFKKNKIRIVHVNPIPIDSNITDWPTFAMRGKDGYLWVCLFKVVQKITTQNGFHIDTVTELNGTKSSHIFEYNNTLIFSSPTTGLHFFDHNAFYHLPIYLEDGKPVVVWSSYVDSKGFLWVSSENGLYESPFINVLEAAKKKKKPFFYRYGIEDGITNTEFNGGATCNYAVTKTERLFYPSEGGVVSFNPREVYPSFYKTSIFIDKVIEDNKEVKIFSNTLDLPNNFSELNLKLTTAYYQDYHNLKIGYRLDSGEWKEIDVNKKDLAIRILRPSSGNHILSLRKRTGFGDNDFVYENYQINVESGLLEKWWFWLFVVGSTYFLMVVFSNFRNKAMLESEKKLEQQIELQTQELKKELETKEVLLSIITHDMIAPLKYVSFISDILRKGKETDKEKIGQALDDIKVTSDNLLSQSQNIVDWIKYTSQRLTVNKTNFELNELVDTVLKLFAPMAKEKKLAFVNNIPTKTMVYSDKNILSIIMNNLISNALKNTQDGKVEIECIETPMDCQITISDTGHGINEKNLNGINSLLNGKRTSNEYLEDGKSGMGYLIIAELTKISEIKIRVESILDKGTKIYLNV